MKFLFVSEGYYPLVSGVPVVVRYLSEELVKQGNEVVVATKTVPNQSRVQTLNGVRIHRFNIDYSFFKKPVGEIEELYKFTSQEKFDYVILECTQCATTDALLPHLAEINSKVVLHSHGFSGLNLKLLSFEGGIRGTLSNTFRYLIWKHYYRTTFKELGKNFDGYMCLSNTDSSYAYLQDVLHQHPTVLGNAAEDMFFNTPSGKDHKTLGKYVENQVDRYLISVANYTTIKNQLGILENFYRMSDTDVSMIFVGGSANSYLDTLKQFKLKLDNKYGRRKVFFLTGVKRQDIPQIVEGAELYICGSRWEAYSVSLIEAMAVGTPFISTNVGNAAQLPGGIVIDQLSQLPTAIHDLLLNRSKMKQLSNEGSRFAYDNCRIQSVVGQLKTNLLSLKGMQ